jgi:hypothetical protein
VLRYTHHIEMSFKEKLWGPNESYLMLCISRHEHFPRKLINYIWVSYEIIIIFFLWLYSPILCLGRLHETFRLISVSRSRTVGWTPWTSDKLVAMPLLTAPGDCDDDDGVGGMNGFGRGNQSTGRKPAPTPFCPPQIPLARPGREPGPTRWEASV